MTAEHRELLGVGAGVSPEELHAAWVRYARLHHPDVGGDPGAFRAGRIAYEALRDPGTAPVEVTTASRRRPHWQTVLIRRLRRRRYATLP